LNGNRRAWLFIIPFFFIFGFGCGTGSKYVGDRDDLPQIFEDNPSWNESAVRAQKKWGVSIPIMMAIIAQESSFDPKARPPKTGGFLWIFPGSRPSSAYGYSQALDGTWDSYRESAGRRWAKRDNFADSIDFVGWYCHQSAVKCGISKNNAYHLYLAYHEGHGGYNSGTYKSKAWLLQIARNVDTRARLYASQIKDQSKDNKKTGSSCLWPF
jgi:hypothetical protein